MTAEYTGDPTTSDKDAVRFLSGDTDEQNPFLQDEEILWLLSENGNAYRAAAAACLQIASGFAKLATSKQEGDLRIDYSTRITDMRALADDLRTKGGGRSMPLVYAGGISRADHDANSDDTDRIPPVFTVGQDDFPIGRQAPDDFRDDPLFDSR